MRTIIRFCLVLALGITLGSALTVAGSANADAVDDCPVTSINECPAQVPEPATFPHRACPDDDGDSINRCVWDARHMGNGLGDSFYVHNHRVHYVTHWRAHHLVDWRRIHHPISRGGELHRGCSVSRGWIRWVHCPDGLIYRWV